MEFGKTLESLLFQSRRNCKEIGLSIDDGIDPKRLLSFRYKH